VFSQAVKREFSNIVETVKVFIKNRRNDLYTLFSVIVLSRYGARIKCYKRNNSADVSLVGCRACGPSTFFWRTDNFLNDIFTSPGWLAWMPRRTTRVAVLFASLFFALNDLFEVVDCA
jgi:hypothetical protein